MVLRRPVRAGKSRRIPKQFALRPSQECENADLDSPGRRRPGRSARPKPGTLPRPEALWRRDRARRRRTTLEGLIVIEILALKEKHLAVSEFDEVVRAFILKFIDLKCSTRPKGLMN